MGDEESTNIRKILIEIEAPIQVAQYIDHIESQLKEERGFTPYQCCPVCNGTGQTIADGFTTNVYQVCKVCNGEMIILTSKQSK